MTQQLDYLRWHCAWCGDDAPLEDSPSAFPYEHGSEEKCTECGEGFSRVMTVREGAHIEALVARGTEPSIAYWVVFGESR